MPYDRPKLSKNLGVKHEAIMLRKPAWYEKVGELMQTFRGTQIESIFPLKNVRGPKCTSPLSQFNRPFPRSLGSSEIKSDLTYRHKSQLE